MSVGREGFDLFTRHGWSALRSSVRYRIRWRLWRLPWGYIWSDTFGKVVCWILGHRQDTFWQAKDGWEDSNTHEEFCCRCYQRTGRAMNKNPGLYEIA